MILREAWLATKYFGLIKEFLKRSEGDYIVVIVKFIKSIEGYGIFAGEQRRAHPKEAGYELVENGLFIPVDYVEEIGWNPC